MKDIEDIKSLRNFLLTKISQYAYKYSKTEDLLMDIGKLNGLNYVLNDDFKTTESEVK